MESLKSECIRVVGVVADNARNMQKGIVLTIPEGVLQMNCFAHTLNLLLKDVAELFAKQFEQANHTEEFFRNRHQAHSAYEGAKQTLKGTLLRAATDTRWGSQVALVASLLKNRNVVEQAILQLRAQKFAFKGSELMWIWEMDWWSTLEGIHVAVSPVQELLEKVQADGVSLGRAVESLHEMLDKIAPAVRRIAPGDAVRAAAIVAQRGP